MLYMCWINGFATFEDRSEWTQYGLGIHYNLELLELSGSRSMYG